MDVLIVGAGASGAVAAARLGQAGFSVVWPRARHPFGTVVGLFDEDMDSWQGVWGQHIHSLEFYETDASRGFLRGAKWGLQPTGGPLSMTRSFPWGVENPIWGPDFPRKLRQRLRRSAMWEHHRRRSAG